jgi:isoaspartyl peptidase/L-asparaginase-like protein (Ntn-hydrolase superfamily)
MRVPLLLVHGGAGTKTMDKERHRAYVESLKRILEEAYPPLARGGSAVTAVARAVELLENDPLYNAGLGSKLQSDGKIRMSASLMDGRRLRFSGCLNVDSRRVVIACWPKPEPANLPAKPGSNSLRPFLRAPVPILSADGREN